MLRFAEVKHIVRLFVRFVLLLAAFLVLFVAATAAVRWVTFHQLGNAPPGSALASLLVQAGRPTILPAIIVTTLVTLFSLLRFSAGRAFALLLTFLLTGLSITFTMIGADYLEHVVSPVSAPLGRRLDPNILYRADNIDFYALDRDGAVFEPVLVHETGRDPALSVFQQAEQDRDSGSLLFRGATDRQLGLDAVENGYWKAFEAPQHVEQLFRDISVAASSFDENARLDNIDFLLLSGSLALVLTSLWVVVRLSRWPLFNIILSLGMARAVFATFYVIQSPSVRDFLGIVLSNQEMEYALPGAFVTLSVLLLLVSVLLPPFHHWKREVSGG
ncbi:MAG: hypothetical protein ACQETQ_01150 [Spirochaetota bacterium]